MNMNRIIIVFTLFLMICIPISICAFADDVVAQEESIDVIEERNLFEDFYYRLFLKDTKDFYDYVMLGTFIVGLLIVMIFQNTHYYVIKKIDIQEEPKKHYNRSKYESKNNYEQKNSYERKNNYQKKKNYHKKKNTNNKVNETSNS